MSESVKIAKEMEELSRLLDQMNSGQYPECDEESAALLEVAALIKKAGAPIRPPQHILDQTLKEVVANLPYSRLNRFRTWMYSGTLGTVASILLIISFNLIPSWPKEIPSVIPAPPTTGFELSHTTQENDGERSLISQTTPSEHLKPSETVSDTTATVGENSPVIKEVPSLPTVIVPTLPPSDQLKPPNQAKHAPIMGEQAPVENRSKFYNKSLYPAEPEAKSSIMSALSLPGQVPDPIIIDQESGMIRQVFNKGTAQEIVVTQMFNKRNAAITKSQPPIMMDTVAEQLETVNKVTIFIYGQEVTIEGSQSKQELLKMAETLTMP